MKQILLGESKFIFVVQIILLLVIVFIVSFFVGISIKLQSASYKLISFFLILFFCFLFVIWNKVLSLNLIIKKDGNIYIKNLMREKEIHINDIHEIKISWLWLHGILVLKSKEKYNFLLDGKHVKEVLFMRNKREIINEYQSRIV